MGKKHRNKNKKISSYRVISTPNDSKIDKEEISSLDEQTNRQRVQAYRERLKRNGFKQISFYIPKNIYDKLQYLKSVKNKSYADIIEALVAKEYYRIINKKS